MQIGIIGGGPRGLVSLSHLVYHFSNQKEQDLSIHIFDRLPAGGQVWRADQSTDLIMNTIAADILLFDHKIMSGPNMYEWSQQQAPAFIKAHPEYNQLLASIAADLHPNSYTPRALVGVYAQWFYEQLVEQLPSNITVKYHRTLVNDVFNNDGKWTLSSDGQQFNLDKVIMTANPSAHELSNSEQSLADYAVEHALSYQGPVYPGDVKQYDIDPNQNVIIRGLGMSFFDEVTKLTVGRGGKFTETADGKLKYTATGNEPHIFAGSRRGVPYYPKAIINMDNDYQFIPHFVTETNIERLKAQSSNHKITVEQFRRLTRHEIELVYYQLILKRNYPNIDREQFMNQFINDPDGAVDNGPFKPNELLRWPQLLNPVAGTPITTTADYQNNVLNWLDAVATDATDGLGNGPLSTALTTFRFIRPVIRKVIANHDFTADDYTQNFLTGFKSNSQLLSNGAPAIRLKQLSALMRAGIVTIIGPQMNVIGANQKFVAMSKFYPKEPVIADALIEARIPKLNVLAADHSLVNHLFNDHLFTPATFNLTDGKQVQINAVQIDPNTDQAIMPNGKIAAGLFIFSTLTEGIHWLTTAFPMVGNDDNQNTADQISRYILHQPTSNPDVM